MRVRLLWLVPLLCLLSASSGCNEIFGIVPGQAATSGSGGAGATGGGGDSGGTAGAGGSPSCAPGTATCEGAVLHACDSQGFPKPDETCDAPAACDAAAQKCNGPGAFGRLALGTGRGCAIEDDGSVRCWGAWGGGAFFTDPPLIQPIALEVPGVKARQIRMGAGFQCALQDNGTVVCWGNNYDAQLGFPASGELPPQPVPGITNAVEVGAATSCACARTSTGDVHCWGWLNAGCLGTADDLTGTQPVPQKIPGVEGAVGIAVSLDGSPLCARLAGGGVTCWSAKIPPRPIEGVGDAIDVAVGYRHILVRSATKGLLWSGLTDDDLDFYAATPLVAGTVTLMTAGAYATAFQTSDGTLVAGRLGNSPAPSAPEPVVGVPPGEIAELVAGCDNVCQRDVRCLRLAGKPLSSSVYCWGSDMYGGLGIGAPSYLPTPQEVTGLGAATALFTGQESTTALLPDGSVSLWGTARGFSPITSPEPAKVIALGSDNAYVSTADTFGRAYVRKQNGDLLFFSEGTFSAEKNLLSSGFTDFVELFGLGHADVGRTGGGQVVVYAAFDDTNVDGLFGDGTTMGVRGQTVAVPGLTGVTAVAAYADDWNAQPAHACALGPSGVVSCWGNNYFGQIGNGAKGDEPVTTPTAVDLGGEAAVSIAAGRGFTCAVVQSGEVHCWGWNELGQIGAGDLSGSASPFKVLGVDAAVSVTARHSHACALLSDKTVACWGDGRAGQLGGGQLAVSKVPMIVPGMQDVVEVRAGTEHTCARRTNGTVACWGSSYSGQLGTGVTGVFPTPSPVLGL